MKQLYTLSFMLSTALAAAQTFTNWTVADGLPSNDLRDVAIGPDGSVHVATAQGLAIWDGGSFTVHNITTHPGLPTNDLQCVAISSDGQVWVGSDFGLSVFDGASYVTFTTADGLGDDVVQNVKEAPNGDIWIATINGATRLSGGAFTAFSSPDIPFGGAQDIAFAANGDVLLSGGLGGVIVYDGSDFSTIGTAQGLLSNRIRSIAIDQDQNKWVATAAGISILDGANVHTGDEAIIFVLPPPDELNPVTDLAFDEQGRLWAGVYVDYLVTVGGVSVRDNGSWAQYEESDGLAGPNVRRLAVDQNDDVWVTTSTGLTRISDTDIAVQEHAALDFALFPVPVADALFVRVDRSTPGLRMEIIDAQGRRCLDAPINGAALDVTSLADGFYTARIGGSVRSFIVRH